MKPEKIFIKNMVCPRCIRVVKEELEKLGLQVKEVALGEAVIETNENLELPLDQIKASLEKAGFEVLEDKNAKIIEKIKSLVLELVQHPEKNQLNINFSDYLEKEIGKNYGYLSQLFSSQENVTIEKYIILQKIEKVKELLVYDELTLSEIAYRLHYSSVAHLSNQFKQVTGFSPSEFKKLKSRPRKNLDSLT